jgi:hypothetical protein
MPGECYSSETRNMVRTDSATLTIGILILCLGLAAGLLAPKPAHAQAQGSSIVGTVTDESGAFVAGARVTVTNLGTQLTRSAITNDRGDYTVPLLIVGTYEVVVEQPGFRRETVTNIRLQINQAYRQDVILRVGQVTEQVTVEANAVTVQTDENTIATRIDAQKIRELPIPSDRNLFRLALLAPGMSSRYRSSVSNSGFGPGFGIAASGQKFHNNNIYLDGAPLRTSIHGMVRMRPSVEAIQEFRVETGWYSAEYGQQSGAQIISTIRPGTNAFHGVLFEFLRNDKFDARNFFQKDPVSGEPREKNPYRRNLFGGVLSGPIIRNKTFFTFNAELLRERVKGRSFGFFPSERMRAGDLTENYFRRNPLAPPGDDNPLIAIRDITSGMPFPNNQIPASRISPIARNFYQFWATPNFHDPTCPTAETCGRSNFVGDTSSEINDDQYFLRIDHTVSQKHALFGRYADQDVVPVSRNLQAQFVDPRFTSFNPKRQRNATVNWTYIVSPAVLNEFKVAYNRDIFQSRTDFSGSDFDILRETGVTGQTTNRIDTGPPGISINRCCSVGRGDPNTIWDENRMLSERISVIKGRHTLKAGTEFQLLRTARRTVSFVNGDFLFDGTHSTDGWADFLMDQPRRIRLGFIPGKGDEGSGSFPNFAYWRWHSYITDDIKLTRTLTMNIGLRYEYNSVFEDTWKQSRNFDYRTQQLFPAVGERGPLHDPDYNNFAPRLGFAWRPLGGTRLVVRAGYGLFYNVNMLNNFLPILAANPPATLRIEELNLPAQVRLRMANADQAQNLLIQSSITATATDPVVGDVHQWNLNIQRALTTNLVFEIAYVGSKSTHFDIPVESNPFLPGTTVRAIPGFSSIEKHDNSANGNYHGLQMKLERDFANGFTLLQTYTWSKTLFDSLACCGAVRPNSPYDRGLERGLAETDVRHRATTAFLYELPWLRGRRGFLGQVLGNWQVNSVVVLESGLPINPTQTIKPVEDGCPRCAHRPDRIADGRLDRSERTLDRFFDTSAFRLVPQGSGRYGNAGRNILTAPGQVNIDFSVFKNFPINERRQRIQFRWESYNFTNTPAFLAPNTDIQSGDFGRIRSAEAGRIMQFGLRWEF